MIRSAPIRKLSLSWIFPWGNCQALSALFLLTIKNRDWSNLRSRDFLSLARSMEWNQWTRHMMWETVIYLKYIHKPGSYLPASVSLEAGWKGMAARMSSTGCQYVHSEYSMRISGNNDEIPYMYVRLIVTVSSSGMNCAGDPATCSISIWKIRCNQIYKRIWTKINSDDITDLRLAATFSWSSNISISQSSGLTKIVG